MSPPRWLDCPWRLACWYVLSPPWASIWELMESARTVSPLERAMDFCLTSWWWVRISVRVALEESEGVFFMKAGGRPWDKSPVGRFLFFLLNNNILDCSILVVHEV